jgi:twitching motility protein PilT
MVANAASDLHLTSGLRPYVRIHGEMKPAEGFETLTSERILEILNEILRPDNRAQLRDEWDTDCAYELPGTGRFRVNGFFDMRGAGSVMRQIPERIPTIEELALPPILREFCMMSKGLVVVTGPTGSGKSTTLAAMVDYINKTRTEHIISIEDPIEFVHAPIKCLINQREVHRDTTGFARALRAALREDPDIVLVGELRDLETIELAVTAAETGQMVYGTLHTMGAHQTVDRIIDAFPEDRQQQVRIMLSESLRGVVSQRLLPRADGGGRVAACEILFATTAVGAMVRDQKTYQIPTAMQTGRREGMLTMDDSILTLVRAGTVTAEEAARYLANRELIQRVRAGQKAA